MPAFIIAAHASANGRTQRLTKNSFGVAVHQQLTDCLELFGGTEKLNGMNTWYCGKCKEHVDATKQTQLWRLPPILLVQLKRFKHQQRGMAMPGVRANSSFACHSSCCTSLWAGRCCLLALNSRGRHHDVAQVAPQFRSEKIELLVDFPHAPGAQDMQERWPSHCKKAEECPSNMTANHGPCHGSQARRLTLGRTWRRVPRSRPMAPGWSTSSMRWPSEPIVLMMMIIVMLMMILSTRCHNGLLAILLAHFPCRGSVHCLPTA